MPEFNFLPYYPSYPAVPIGNGLPASAGPPNDAYALAAANPVWAQLPFNGNFSTVSSPLTYASPVSTDTFSLTAPTATSSNLSALPPTGVSNSTALLMQQLNLMVATKLAPILGSSSAATNTQQAPQQATASGTPVSTVNEGDVAAAIRFFEQQDNGAGGKWTHAQAAGIVANLLAESGLRKNPPGYNDGGQAYGVAQWHPDRQARFKDFKGKDIREATLTEQLEFVNWELINHQKTAAEKLRAATTPYAAGDAFSRYYERPLHTESEAQKRGNKAEEIA